MMWFGAPKPAGQPPGLLQPECLYSGPLPLIFRDSTPSSDSSPETKRSDTVIATLSYCPTTSSKRALEIRLTDAADPFFLWQCVLTEDDYFQMKREQALVVEFARFPSFLIGLVEKCQQHFDEQRPLFAAYFYSQGDTQSAVLSFVETNEYKQNSYAVLRMTPVSEAAMKKHLAGLMSTFKDEIQSLRNTASSSFPPRSANPTSTGTSASTPSRNYVERCRSLEERQAAIEQELADLRDSKARLETEASELRGQQKILLSENERLKQEVYAFRSSAHGAGISARLAGLEQLVKEKDDAMARLNDLVQETREAKQLLESTISQLRSQLASQQEQQQKHSEETLKLHDTIRKLQEDLRTAKSKVRSASTLAQEQERLRREAQGMVDATRQELAEAREQLERRFQQIGELEESKRTLQRELDDLRHLNEGNEKVISWLHRLIPDERLSAILADQPVETTREQSMEQTMQTTVSNNEESTASSEYPLAMRREVRQFFDQIGVQIDPETSLPRFTPEELAEKQKQSDTSSTGSVNETMNSLSIV